MTAPPSPVVIALTGWNENVHMSERAQLPTGPSGVDAPSACAASSTIDPGPRRRAPPGRRGARRSARRPARRTRRPRPGRGSASWDRCRRSRRSRRRSARSSRWRRTRAATSARGRPVRCRPRRARACRAAVPLANATACAGAGLRAQRPLEGVDGGPARQPVAAQDGSRPRRCRRRRRAGGHTGSHVSIRRSSGRSELVTTTT